MKIAIVTETYPPEINGVARTIGRMVKEMLERGHQIQLFRPKQDFERDESTDLNLKTIRMWGLRIPMYSDLRFGLPQFVRLIRLWSVDRPHLVQVVTEGPLGLAAVFAARALKIPVISDFHTNFHAYAKHYHIGPFLRPINAYMRMLHNLTVSTLAPTQQMRADLLARGYKNVAVVGRGADLELFTPERRSEVLRTSWGLAPGELAVLHVGRLAPEKNPELLIEAWRAMHLKNPSLKFVIVGDGPSRVQLQEALPEAVFCGMRRAGDLADHFASGDIFLFPSLTETFGNVLIEAMASGLAIIAFDEAAAHKHLRHDENAYLAPSGDTFSFIALAERLALDPDRVQRFRAHTKLLAKNCSWSQVCDDLERLYFTYANGPRGDETCTVTGIN